MYIGTQLTMAIHRRLLSRFFLRERGRLYTSYFQKVSGKSVLEGNGSPTQPTLYKQCLGSLTFHSISRYEQELWDGAYGFFLSQED